MVPSDPSCKQIHGAELKKMTCSTASTFLPEFDDTLKSTRFTPPPGYSLGVGNGSQGILYTSSQRSIHHQIKYAKTNGAHGVALSISLDENDGNTPHTRSAYRYADDFDRASSVDDVPEPTGEKSLYLE